MIEWVEQPSLARSTSYGALGRSPLGGRHRLVALLEFFDRMSIAGIERTVARLAIQQISGLQRGLEQDVRLTARCPPEDIAADGSGSEKQVDNRRHLSPPTPKPPIRLRAAVSFKGNKRRVTGRIDSNDRAALGAHHIDRQPIHDATVYMCILIYHDRRQ